jgi:7,8-dihydroneopterin aldolase/epimerase/oxygenase
MIKADLDTITLEAMSFHTRIGVLPHEREHPQPVEIDLTAWIRPETGVVDYRTLYADVRECALAAGLSYLEDLAESVASRVLANADVFRVRVAVRKPHVALGGPLRHAEVAILRQQDA